MEMLASGCGSRCHRLISSRNETHRMALPLFRSSPPSTKGASFATRSVGQTTTIPRALRAEGTRFGTTSPHQLPPSRIRAQSITTRTRTRASIRNRIPTAANPCRLSIINGKQHCLPKRGAAQRSQSSSTGAVAAASDKPKTTADVPDFRTLRWVAFTTGLPFIGFGFMDNAILIIAGDAIDTSLGVTLGISTLCAAAIGNIISDLAGIGFATYIEDFCATILKMPVPKLSDAQRRLRSVRFASQGGTAIGMTLGCLLGMIPLLFIDSNKADRLREKARLERLFKDVVNEAKTLVEAELSCLYLRVDKNDESNEAQSKKSGVGILTDDYHPSVNGEYLYAMYYVEPSNRPRRRASTTETLMRMVSSGSRPAPAASDLEDETIAVSAHAPPAPNSPSPTRVIPIGKGIVSRAVLTGTTWNIAGNLMDEPDFYPLSSERSRGNEDLDPERYRDIALAPILDGKGRVIAVLEALNKERPEGSSRIAALKEDINNNSTLDNSDEGFTDQDVEILLSLASHVSVSLQKIYQDGVQDEEDFGRLRDTIRILKEGKGIKRSNTRRRKSMGCEGGDSHGAGGNLAANSSSDVPSSAGRKSTQLFPDE